MTTTESAHRGASRPAAHPKARNENRFTGPLVSSDAEPTAGGARKPCSPLATPQATRELLEQHGIQLKKSLGQNFLVDDGVVGRIVALSEVCESDVVLEIGPGIGTLTLALLPRAAHVISVERDETLAPVLRETAGAHPNFSLILQDAMRLDPAQVAQAHGQPPNKLIANLPYAVAATVLLRVFEQFDGVRSATVMVQREVADRICARPGSKQYGAYTVLLRLHAEVQGRFDVQCGCFMPPPHVTSTVVRLNRAHAHTREGKIADSRVCEAAKVAAKAAFAQRRKTIRNSMRSSLGCSCAKLDFALDAAGIDGAKRAEALTAQDYIALGKALIDAEMIHN